MESASSKWGARSPTDGSAGGKSADGAPAGADSAKADLAISRELGQATIRDALREVQEAQNRLAAALAAISPVLGGIPTWKKGSALHDRIKAFWYEVDALGRRLALKGGPRVDDVNLAAEKQRRAALGKAR